MEKAYIHVLTEQARLCTHYGPQSVTCMFTRTLPGYLQNSSKELYFYISCNVLPLSHTKCTSLLKKKKKSNYQYISKQSRKIRETSLLDVNQHSSAVSQKSGASLWTSVYSLFLALFTDKNSRKGFKMS